MLGKEMLGIHDLIMNVVSQIIRKSIPNDSKGLSFVMTLKILDIFQ